MLVDNICSKITFYIFNFFKIIFCPFKFVVKFLTNYFQRPYSFCFLISFVLLVIPALLLIIILIQNYEFINSIETFNIIFYFTLFNLILNYLFVFHIHYLYGIHKIKDQNNEAESFNIKTFTKFIIHYIFKETKVFYIGLYFLSQIGFCIFSLWHINSTDDYYSEKFNVPVIIYFTKFAIIFNLIFTSLHDIMYILLYFFVLCTINKSCLCRIISDCCCIKNDKNLNRIKNDNYENEEKLFSEMGLNCFKFFGVYDYEKELNIKRENNSINVENI